MDESMGHGRHRAARRRSEVVIIGAGPTGLMLANILGRHGRTVTVLESRQELIDYPRAIGLDDDSLRSLQAAGLVEAVLPHTTPQHIVRMVNGRGTPLLVSDPGGDELGWPRKSAFVQSEVDRVMYEGLARYEGVEVLFGHEAVDVTETDGGVVVEVEARGDDGGTVRSTVEAQYLVGCEGGRSATRKRMGVDFDGVSPPTRWLVIDVADDPVGTPNLHQGADPARPYVSVGLPHGIRRWELMLLDGETDEEMTDPQRVQQLLAAHVPDPSSLEVIGQRIFAHHARVASDFRRGRQLIAGDAAHLMPVWMGQGWNSGIRDATNLGWKLAAVLAGQAEDQLLDTYSSERRDHARATVDMALTFGRAIKVTHPVLAAARDTASAGMRRVPAAQQWFAQMKWKPRPRIRRGVVAEADGRRRDGSGAPLIPVLTADVGDSPVGTPFPQPKATSADAGQQRLDDLIGDGWAVLTWGADPTRRLPEHSLERLRTLGARLVAIVPETQREWLQQRAADDVLVLGDSTGDLKRWFDQRPTPMVFLRPDRFIAGACLHQEGAEVLDGILAALSFRGQTAAVPQ